VKIPNKKTTLARIENNTKENILRFAKIKTINEIISAIPRENIVNLRSRLGLPKNILFLQVMRNFCFAKFAFD
jgi:hypothetical protein